MKILKRMVVMLLLVGGLFAAIYSYQQFAASMMAQFLASNANPPVTVSAMAVEYQPWQPRLEAIGSLRSIQGVSIQSEVSGVVKQVHFQSGQEVRQGALLVELDSTVETAQLAALRASRELAEINLERDRQQFRINAISQAQLDAAESELKSRKAQEAQQQAVIDKRQIRAPFSGRLGIRQVEVGELLSPGVTIASLQNTERLYVDFSLPQQYLSQVRTGQRFTLHVEQNGQQAVEVEGEIHAIHSEIEQESRNLRIEGVIDNRGGALDAGNVCTPDGGSWRAGVIFDAASDRHQLQRLW